MNSIVLKLSDYLLLEKPRKLDTPRGNGDTLAEPRRDLVAALAAVVPATEVPATEAEAEAGSLPTADLQMWLTGDTVSLLPLLSTTTRCPRPWWSVVRLTAQSTICLRPSVTRPSRQWRPRFSPALATSARSSVTRRFSARNPKNLVWSVLHHHAIYCGSK